MNDEKTLFQHEDGSVAVRRGMLPVFVGMTVFAKPNVPLIVTDVSLHILSADDGEPEPDVDGLVTRLHVKLAGHPSPETCTYSEIQ